MASLPFRPRRLPPRAAGLVMPLILSVLMTFVVSGVSTFTALGATAEFLARWPVSWAVSWVIAFPTLLLVRRIVALLVAPHPLPPAGQR